MKQKKIIALVSLLVLIGGVVALAMWIKNRPTEKQKAFQEICEKERKIKQPVV